MQKLTRFIDKHSIIAVLSFSFGLILWFSPPAGALQVPPNPTNPQSGSVGLEGTINASPPSTAPTISVPTNGQSFSSEPITVNGLCISNLLVRLFSNGVFIGSALCINNSFSITASLFDGQNQLTAQQYDALNQSSPVSNQITVMFNSGATTAAPQLILTSVYAERGANPGSVLSWPISITGGTPPFAISIDWGDASSADLISQPLAGTFNAQHTYGKAGVYKVLVKATDQAGATAYLQLVGIGNGTITSGSTSNGTGTTTTKTKVIWWPAAVIVPFIIIAFWLGNRHQLITLRRKMEQSNEQVRNE
jgi:hypothetical protein